MKTDVEYREQKLQDLGEDTNNDYAPADIMREIQALQDPETVIATKKYMRKLDGVILPAITLLYFFEYLDRGNVAASLLLPMCFPG